MAKYVGVVKNYKKPTICNKAIIMYSPVSGISHRSPVKPFVHLSQTGKKKKKKDLNFNEGINLYMLVVNMIEKLMIEI